MKEAKIFMNGKSQAIRLPKEYRFNKEEVYIKKVGNILVVFPELNAWDTFYNSLNKFSDDFMNERNQPEQQIRENLFE
jgi:antitoxin VapB